MTLDFSQNYILENERVKLVPLVEEHMVSLKTVANEEELWTYFLGRSDGSENFEEYVQDALRARDSKKEYPFAVFDKTKRQFAGSTRFFDYHKDLNTIRLGYTWYGKAFRGTGLNKNCKYLLFQFAFKELDLERVGLGAHAENTISIAAMQSVGCTQEGVVRSLFPSIHGGGRADAVLLGILKNEWFQGKKENLKNKL